MSSPKYCSGLGFLVVGSICSAGGVRCVVVVVVFDLPEGLAVVDDFDDVVAFDAATVTLPGIGDVVGWILVVGNGGSVTPAQRTEV